MSTATLAHRVQATGGSFRFYLRPRLARGADGLTLREITHV